jgi:hypothetical protein
MATTKRKPRSQNTNSPTKISPPEQKSETIVKDELDIEAGFEIQKNLKGSEIKFKENEFDANTQPKIYELRGNNGITYFVDQSNLNVFDKETKKRRWLRYSPNQSSVWADEQDEFITSVPIKFRNNLLTVGRDYPQLIEFLDKHPDNVANGGTIFHEVDSSTNAEEILEKEFNSYDAIAIVRTRSVSELMPLVYKFSIPTNQANSEIKLALLSKAKSDPNGFMKAMEDPIIKLQAVVRQAMDFDIIREENGRIVWTDSGNIILTTIAGKTPEYTLARFFSSDKGLPTYEALVEQINSALA